MSVTGLHNFPRFQLQADNLKPLEWFTFVLQRRAPGRAPLSLGQPRSWAESSLYPFLGHFLWFLKTVSYLKNWTKSLALSRFEQLFSPSAPFPLYYKASRSGTASWHWTRRGIISPWLFESPWFLEFSLRLNIWTWLFWVFMKRCAVSLCLTSRTCLQWPPFFSGALGSKYGCCQQSWHPVCLICSSFEYKGSVYCKSGQYSMKKEVQLCPVRQEQTGLSR